MKIQYQLWLIFSSLFVIVCFIVYIIIANTYEQRLQAGYEQLSITQGSAILDQLRETYPYFPNRSIGYLITYSEQLNSRLIMLDHDKKVYADSFQQLRPNSTINLDILNKANIPGSIFSETEPYGYVQYTLLPFQTREEMGYLLMVQEADQLYNELKTFRNWMVQTLIIAVIAFFIISYFVSSWFTKPIRQIISQLKKITPQKRTFLLKYQRNDEIKDLIDATQNMIEELNIYDERQRRFLSTSSHELKTPLATMHLILENLPYVRDNEDTYREFVQDLSFQVQKMKKMVDQLLQINRIWDRILQKVKISSQDIQNYLTQSFLHIAKDKQINIEFDLEPLNLYVDKELFLRGIDNLVSNAIRYSPKGKSINISIIREREQIKISVCDKGIGISSEDLPHIFEPFYRSNDATVWNQEGSGLGLTIVKQMIELHKGKIIVETEENKGTCIHIFLPTLK